MSSINEALQAKFPNLFVKTLINLKFTVNWLDSQANNFLGAYNITIQQYNILRILRGANGALTVNTVKDRMIEKSPNTTRLMDKLLDKQLLSRVRCENDRRVVYVEITSKGLDLLQKINIEQLETPFKNFSEEELNTINSFLDTVRAVDIYS